MLAIISLIGPSWFLLEYSVMKVLFVAGCGPITTETKESAAFYKESLGLSFNNARLWDRRTHILLSPIDEKRQ